MFSSGEMVIASIIGFIVGSILVATFWAASEDAEVYYSENVCTYLEGELKEDVCIVDGRVVEIKGMS